VWIYAERGEQKQCRSGGLEPRETHNKTPKKKKLKASHRARVNYNASEKRIGRPTVDRQILSAKLRDLTPTTVKKGRKRPAPERDTRGNKRAIRLQE